MKRIFEIFSPSGKEEKMTEYISSVISKNFDECITDNFGNLILHKKGEGEKICFECGVDEPFLLRGESSEDKVRFMAPWQISPKALIGKTMKFENGAAFMLKSEKTPEESRISNLYSEDKTDEDTYSYAVLNPAFCETEKHYISSSLRYKAAAFALCLAAEEIGKCDKNLYFAFTVQKLLGARGERAMLSKYAFDEVISVFCLKEDKYFSSGDGVFILAKDKKTPASPKIKNELLKVAEKENIKSRVIIRDEDLFIGVPRISGGGALTGAIGMVFDNNSINRDEILKSDIENVTKLIKSYCK